MKETLLIIFFICISASAEETIATKLPRKGLGNLKDKADELITNRRFRASNGSLSRFSMNMSLSYSGGALNNPFSADRPNISNAGDTTSIAGIQGSLNGSFRIDKLNRLNIGAGLQVLAPFHSSINTNDSRAQREFDENKGELDISNPSLSYTHMNKFFGVQSIISTALTKYTASNLTDFGYNNSLDFSLNTMYDFGGSSLSVGALVVFNKYFFNKDDDSLLIAQNDTVWGVLPQLEYVINDTFNLRTIIRSHWYQNNRMDGVGKFTRRPIIQSVGLGISLNRDVFLYPNIQFSYENMQASNTNIGLTANINMF